MPDTAPTHVPLGERIRRFASTFSTPFIIALVGSVVALTFTLLFYQPNAGEATSNVATDGNLEMGLGLLHYGTLAMYPGTDPAITRGPAYPAFVAGAISLFGGDPVVAVAIAQSVLLGLICFFVFYVAAGLWDNRVGGLIAASLCALHPVLWIFTGRVMNELFLAFLLTVLCFCLLRAVRTASPTYSVLSGLVIGLLTLTKSTWLPLVILIPLASLSLMRLRSQLWQTPVLIFFAALAAIAPWTIRNYNLTGKLIPVHTQFGYNVQRGDVFASHAGESPLSYGAMWEKGWEEFDAVRGTFPKGLAAWEYDWKLDSALLDRSIERYKDQPLLPVRKVALNAVWFWTLGETPTKTLVFSALQIPLFLLFIVAWIRGIRKYGARSPQALLGAIIVLYWLTHTPVFAFFRLSVPLIPAMIAYAVMIVAPPPKRVPILLDETMPEAPASAVAA